MNKSKEIFELEKRSHWLSTITMITALISMIAGVYSFVSKPKQIKDNEVNIQINTLNVKEFDRNA